MDISSLIPHIESLIFASDKPLTPDEITELLNNAFGFMEDKVVTEQVDAALDGIVEKYNSEFYPFDVRLSGGGLGDTDTATFGLITTFLTLRRRAADAPAPALRLPGDDCRWRRRQRAAIRQRADIQARPPVSRPLGRAL